MLPAHTGEVEAPGPRLVSTTATAPSGRSPRLRARPHWAAPGVDFLHLVEEAELTDCVDGAQRRVAVERPLAGRSGSFLAPKGGGMTSPLVTSDRGSRPSWPRTLPGRGCPVRATWRVAPAARCHACDLRCARAVRCRAGSSASRRTSTASGCDRSGAEASGRSSLTGPAERASSG